MDRYEMFLGSLIFALTITIVALYVQDQKQWDTFSYKHHCKVVAHIDGDIVTTVMPTSNGGVGVGVGSTSSKTGYLCDDGVTYYR